MIRITQIKLPPGHSAEVLEKKIRKILRLQENIPFTYSIVKQSIDARKKPDIVYQYAVDVELNGQDKSLHGKAHAYDEQGLVNKLKNAQVTIAMKQSYQFPESGSKPMKHRPVIIGTGPAGLFCGYMLAKYGYKPILLERGEEVNVRTETVEQFWNTGLLNPESNVQFGEGGAGTFSDGKLNTLVKDKSMRNYEVLRIFTEAGAPEPILYEAKPHIGTDILRKVVENMRNTIIDCGGQVRFNSKVTDIILADAMSDMSFSAVSEDNTGIATAGSCICGVVVNGTETIDCDNVVLAIGHSARDTFEMLHEHGIPMEAKAFAVGFRVEHKQSMINASQYGQSAPEHLPAAPYKLTAQTESGRGVYSFCMCPGGYVVNASSEEGRLAVNGMSYSKRDGDNADSAIIVTVTPEDYCGMHYEEPSKYPPLSGIAFQRKLEEKAFALADGRVPVQTYGDFKAGTTGSTGSVTPCIKGSYAYADVRSILPEELNLAFIEGMEQFERKIHGFAADDTLVEGIESRTSSPVRIHRDETLQSVVRGLYPCGEGAGYAGGITSAAMDGIKIAEEIAKVYDTFQ